MDEYLTIIFGSIIVFTMMLLSCQFLYKTGYLEVFDEKSHLILKNIAILTIFFAIIGVATTHFFSIDTEFRIIGVEEFVSINPD